MAGLDHGGKSKTMDKEECVCVCVCVCWGSVEGEDLTRG